MKIPNVINVKVKADLSELRDLIAGADLVRALREEHKPVERLGQSYCRACVCDHCDTLASWPCPIIRRLDERGGR